MRNAYITVVNMGMPVTYIFEILADSVKASTQHTLKCLKSTGKGGSIAAKREWGFLRTPTQLKYSLS